MNKSPWLKRGILISLLIVTIISITFIINRKNSDTEFDNGTNIKLESLNNNQIENLNKLSKVWGFVKYYHPKAIDASVNWDYELLRVMPKVIDAKDSNEVNTILYDWVNALGGVKENVYENDNEVMIDADTNWIKDDKYVSKELSDLLVSISKSYVSERKKAYVNFTSDSIFSEFKNEEAYPDMKYDDDGFKILSLFRYWNIIQYYYPYRTVIGEDWNAVLNEFMPKFIECDEELAYKLTVQELTTKVHDTHVTVKDNNKVLNKYWGVNIAPIRFLLVENKIIVTEKTENYANDSKVQIGDVVLKINDKDIFEVIKEKSKYISFSNDKATVNNLSPYLFRTSEDKLKLTIERDGKEIEENINCYDIRIFDGHGESHNFLEGNIGYINPGTLKPGEIDVIMSKFKETKGLIVDLRNYPSEFIPYSLGNYLIPKKTIFTRVTAANRAVPGEFIFTDDNVVGSDNPDYYKGKVILIINEETQSRGEFTTMALRNAPNATVIGENSVGADGDIVYISLPGGISTTFTGIGIYNPDKSETQRIGVTPDIYVSPTIKGIRAGRDELLDKAIELINN